MARRNVDRVEHKDLVATPMRERGTREDGRSYWRIRRMAPGRPTVATGWWTKAEAADAVVAAHRASPSLPYRPRGVVLTVGDLLARWVEAQEQRQRAGEIAERSVVSYRQTARHWQDAIGDVAVDRVDRAVVEDTLRGWRAAGYSARTARLAHRVIVMVVHWGARRKLCPDADLREMQAAAVDPEERINCSHTPTRAEFDRVLPMITPNSYQNLAELLAWTGARVGEALAMKVGAWDREKRELSISGRDPRRARRGKVRTRPFPVVGRLGVLLDMLSAGRDASEPMCGALAIQANSTLNECLARACRRAGVPRFTAHGIRRMVAMELVDNGDARHVADLTGHSVKVLMQDYIRPTTERLRDVVSRAHGPGAD